MIQLACSFVNYQHIGPTVYVGDVGFSNLRQRRSPLSKPVETASFKSHYNAQLIGVFINALTSSRNVM